MSTINGTVKSRSSQLTKCDEADLTMPELRPIDYKSVPQLFYLQPMKFEAMTNYRSTPESHTHLPQRVDQLTAGETETTVEQRCRSILLNIY